MSNTIPSAAQQIHQLLSKPNSLYMLGAKNLRYNKSKAELTENNIFDFRIRGSRAVNYIKITYLYGLDLYTMELGKIHGDNYTPVAIEEEIYFDMVRPLIEKHTGLRTTL